MAVIRRKLIIENTEGLHARPAAVFARIVNQYQAKVSVRRGLDTVNGKSMVGLLLLNVRQGSLIEVEVDGPDAHALLLELERFFPLQPEEHP